MKGQKLKAPVADAILYLVYYELELLLEKGIQLREIEMENGNDKLLEMLRDIPLEQLPEVINDLKTAQKEVSERIQKKNKHSKRRKKQ